MTYAESILSVLVLDYRKPIESRLCLESVRRHVKVPHRVIFCDNGSGEDYPAQFAREGLVHQLIVNTDSRGLGLGTRDLFAASFSPYSLYLQNDQFFVRDFTEDDLFTLTKHLAARGGSVSLAGSPCGAGVYSERAHFIETAFYKDLDQSGYLGYHGAGRYHDGPWREEQMQRLYKKEGLTHWEPHTAPWVADNGVFAVRDMGTGGVYVHRTDTKQMAVVVRPTLKNAAYPKVSDAEFAVIAAGNWLDWTIPHAELPHSFHCWDHTPLARAQPAYLADLRARFNKTTT